MKTNEFSTRNPGIVGISSVIILSLLIGTSVYAIYFDPAVEYQTRTGGGWLKFTTGFNASKFNYWGNILIFFDFNETGRDTFGDLGFDVPAGCNITVGGVRPREINLTAVYVTACTVKVYVPDYESPVNVTGATWTYSPTYKSVLLLIEENTNIIISWESIYYTENNTYSEPAVFLPVLTPYLMEGDISGLVLSQYTLTMGSSFFVILLLIASVWSVRRVGIVVTSIFWVLFWGIFNIVIPPQGLNLAVFILLASIGGLLIVLLLSRRSNA